MMSQKYVEGLVSIIIPVFNSAKCLNQCISSVINQSYKNIEVILVETESIDTSTKLCDVWSRDYKNVITIHKKNKGQSDARNVGIENSKGEFIMFVDSDDTLENIAIECLIEEYNKSNANLIVGDFKQIREIILPSGHERFFLTDKLLTKTEIIDYVRIYLKRPNKYPLFVTCWGKLFKSSIIKENNIKFNLKRFEDVAFNFDYLKHVDEMFFLNKSLYNYTIQNNYTSLTMNVSNNPEIMFEYKQAFIKIKEYLKPYVSDIDIKKEVANADVSYAIIQLIRICGQINDTNKRIIYKCINEVVNNSEFQCNLQYYVSIKGNSKIIPILIKLKLVYPIMWICKHKANLRYGGVK